MHVHGSASAHVQVSYVSTRLCNALAMQVHRAWAQARGNLQAARLAGSCRFWREASSQMIMPVVVVVVLIVVIVVVVVVIESRSSGNSNNSTCSSSSISSTTTSSDAPAVIVGVVPISFGDVGKHDSCRPLCNSAQFDAVEETPLVKIRMEDAWMTRGAH